MTDIPIILRCPRGEEWPAESFTNTVEYKERIQSQDTIRFICPLGHCYTVRQLVQKKTLTPEQALDIIAEAQRRLPEAREKARRLTREWKKGLKG